MTSLHFYFICISNLKTRCKESVAVSLCAVWLNQYLNHFVALKSTDSRSENEQYGWEMDIFALCNVFIYILVFSAFIYILSRSFILLSNHFANKIVTSALNSVRQISFSVCIFAFFELLLHWIHLVYLGVRLSCAFVCPMQTDLAFPFSNSRLPLCPPVRSVYTIFILAYCRLYTCKHLLSTKISLSLFVLLKLYQFLINAHCELQWASCTIIPTFESFNRKWNHFF